MKNPLSHWRSLAAWLMAAALVAACGGVDSGGTGMTAETSSSGRITGFGSVIVNGVRFDDNQASVVDDDGTARSRDDLRLGMVIDVQGLSEPHSGNGVARRIQFGNDIAGPVTAVDAANSRLTVLGQAVQVDPDTFFGGYAHGFADVLAGDLVEVFAFYDPTSGVYAATRIERQTALAAFTLRGRISALGSTSFAIGAAVIDYSGIAPSALPALSNGLSVRVSLQTAPVAGRWVATTVRTSQRNFPATGEAEVEGYVSGFASPASFFVAGVPVDASGPAVSFRHGSLNQIANGVRAEVEGEMRNGVLVASVVDLKQQGGGRQEFELHGAITSVNAAARSFVLHGVTVFHDNSTNFTSGSAAQLAAGTQVEVRGGPSADGAGVLATKIKFER
ncbi:MAG TPA: DUF5666 domain-containing protein [Rhizobacter sp.]|nr:DUF5666 domain-containing protein [Rhizobacter sp.]